LLSFFTVSLKFFIFLFFYDLLLIYAFFLDKLLSFFCSASRKPSCSFLNCSASAFSLSSLFFLTVSLRSSSLLRLSSSCFLISAIYCSASNFSCSSFSCFSFDKKVSLAILRSSSNLFFSSCSRAHCSASYLSFSLCLSFNSNNFCSFFLR